MSTPQSEINVCKGVPLTPSYEHTLYFDSLDAQQLYFSGKVDYTFSDYTYLRKSWDIKVETTMYNAKTWSYLYFTNPRTNTVGGDRRMDKTYYYFITNVEYVNDYTVKLSLELDVMQTYMFDYELLPCFVEREHSAFDDIYRNTVEEGLELGDYITQDEEDIDLTDLSIMVMTTFDPVLTTGKDNIVNEVAYKYSGVFSGLGIYAVDMSKSVDLGLKLKQFADWGLSEGIVAMWMYPKALLNFSSMDDDDDSIFKRLNNAGIDPMYHYTGRPKDDNGMYYLGTRENPHYASNGKLLTYPYTFLYITNNNGESATYKYELFENPDFTQFTVTGAISPEGVCRIYPHNYKNESFAYEDGLNLPGFPTCAWNSDVYKLWLAQNQNQQKLGYFTAGATILAGLGTIIGGVLATGGTGGLGAGVGVAGVGAGISMISSGASKIGGMMAQKSDMEAQPPQAKGGSSANVNVNEGKQLFTIKRKSIRTEYAMKIDDYFSMYGYKTHMVKIPNRAVREVFTYTKTVGCIINGDICTDDKIKIESIYNNGVTFWRDPKYFGDYRTINAPII